MHIAAHYPPFPRTVVAPETTLLSLDPMPTLAALTGNGLVLWTILVVTGYTGSLAGNLLPDTLRSALPFLAPGTTPDLALFAARAGSLALALLATIVAGLGAGGPLLRFLGLHAGGMLRQAPFGIATAGIALLGLGLVGCWQAPLLLAVPAAAVLAGLASPGRGRKAFPWPHRVPRLPLFLWLPSLVSLWAVGLVLLAPETFQDPLRYHLFFPKRFLLERKFVFCPDYFFWSYMGPLHMVYAAWMAACGDAGAKAVNAACALLGLAALWRMARIALPDQSGRHLLMALTLTAPGLVLVTGSAFAEHGVSLFVLLAAEALLDARAGARSRLRLAALALGIAGSVKYTAVFGAAGIALMALGDRDLRVLLRPRHLARAVAPALLPLLPWLVLRWWWTGDPVSPVLARLGVQSLDAPSRPALDVAYGFTAQAYGKWAADPGSFFCLPIVFAGAHEGFWEHPGPALACLFPLILLPGRRLASAERRIFHFAVGSAGAWVILFGAASPHYVAGLYGGWTLGGLVLLGRTPRIASEVVGNLFRYCVFVQALLAVSAAAQRFQPRDVALGIVTPDRHLEEVLLPRAVHFRIRSALEKAAPSRGVVYDYGDDQSYYLAGRVQPDYEYGSSPLFWRIAAASSGPAELRKRLRQRGWTHEIYTTLWPHLEGRAGRLAFRHDERTLEVVQAFRARYASLVLRLEPVDRGNIGPSSYAYAFLSGPRAGRTAADRTRRIPFLPGAEGITWTGDIALENNRLREADASYREALLRFPRYGVLHDRLARLAFIRGDPGAARRHLARAAAVGWEADDLRREGDVLK